MTIRLFGDDATGHTLAVGDVVVVASEGELIPVGDVRIPVIRDGVIDSVYAYLRDLDKRVYLPLLDGPALVTAGDTVTLQVKGALIRVDALQMDDIH